MPKLLQTGGAKLGQLTKLRNVDLLAVSHMGELTCLTLQPKLLKSYTRAAGLKPAVFMTRPSCRALTPARSAERSDMRISYGNL